MHIQMYSPLKPLDFKLTIDRVGPHLTLANLLEIVSSELYPDDHSRKRKRKFLKAVNQLISEENYEAYCLIDILYLINHRLTMAGAFYLPLLESYLYCKNNEKNSRRLLIELEIHKVRTVHGCISLYLRNTIRQIAFRYKETLDEFFYYLKTAREYGLNIGRNEEYFFAEALKIEASEVEEQIREGLEDYFELKPEAVISFVVNAVLIANSDDRYKQINQHSTFRSEIKDIVSAGQINIGLYKKLFECSESNELDRNQFSHQLLLKLIRENFIKIKVERESFIFYREMVKKIITKSSGNTSIENLIFELNKEIKQIEKVSDCKELKSSMSSMSFQKKKLCKILWYLLEFRDDLLPSFFDAVSQLTKVDVGKILAEKNEETGENAIIIAARVLKNNHEFLLKMISILDEPDRISLLLSVDDKKNNALMTALINNCPWSLFLFEVYAKLEEKEEDKLILHSNVVGNNLLMLTLGKHSTLANQLIKILMCKPILLIKKVLFAANKSHCNALIIGLKHNSAALKNLFELMMKLDEEYLVRILETKVANKMTLFYLTEASIVCLPFIALFRKISDVKKVDLLTGVSQKSKISATRLLKEKSPPVLFYYISKNIDVAAHFIEHVVINLPDKEFVRVSEERDNKRDSLLLLLLKERPQLSEMIFYRLQKVKDGSAVARILRQKNFHTYSILSKCVMENSQVFDVILDLLKRINDDSLTHAVLMDGEMISKTPLQMAMKHDRLKMVPLIEKILLLKSVHFQNELFDSRLFDLRKLKSDRLETYQIMLSVLKLLNDSMFVNFSVVEEQINHKTLRQLLNNAIEKIPDKPKIILSLYAEVKSYQVKMGYKSDFFRWINKKADTLKKIKIVRAIVNKKDRASLQELSQKDLSLLESGRLKEIGELYQNKYGISFKDKATEIMPFSRSAINVMPIGKEREQRPKQEENFERWLDAF